MFGIIKHNLIQFSDIFKFKITSKKLIKIEWFVRLLNDMQMRLWHYGYINSLINVKYIVLALCYINGLD